MICKCPTGEFEKNMGCINAYVVDNFVNEKDLIEFLQKRDICDDDGNLILNHWRSVKSFRARMSRMRPQNNLSF